MEQKTKLTIADIIVCAVLVAICVFSVFAMKKSGGDTVEVRCDEDIYTYDLNTNRVETLTSNGHTLTLLIKDGSASIKESSCSDKVCVKSGTTDDPSKPIVCAPAKVVVRIKASGGDRPDADFIAGR